MCILVTKFLSTVTLSSLGFLQNLRFPTFFARAFEDYDAVLFPKDF